MGSSNSYETNQPPQSAQTSAHQTHKTVVENDLISENERLRQERLQHSNLRQAEVIRNNRLARENDQLRNDQINRENAGAQAFITGLIVFLLVTLGLGAFYYLGRDAGVQEALPPAPALPDAPDINITAPQPPAVNVQPPDVNVEAPAVPPVNIELPPAAAPAPAEAPAEAPVEQPAAAPEASQDSSETAPANSAGQ